MARTRSTKSSRAAASKNGPKPFCRMLPRMVPQLPASVTSNPLRVAAIILSRAKWVNGTVLHYGFFRSGHFAVPKAQADAAKIDEAPPNIDPSDEIKRIIDESLNAQPAEDAK